MEIVQKIGEEYEGEGLISYLRHTADSIVAQSYVRKFDAEELRKEQWDFLSKSLEYDEVEVEKKRISSEHVAKMKTLKSEINQIKNNLRDEGVLTKGELFGFRNEETRQMDLYDSLGNYMYSRAMSATERQGFLMQGSHIKAMTGTEN